MGPTAPAIRIPGHIRSKHATLRSRADSGGGAASVERSQPTGLASSRGGWWGATHAPPERVAPTGGIASSRLLAIGPDLLLRRAQALPWSRRARRPITGRYPRMRCLESCGPPRFHPTPPTQAGNFHGLTDRVHRPLAPRRSGGSQVTPPARQPAARSWAPPPTSERVAPHNRDCGTGDCGRARHGPFHFHSHLHPQRFRSPFPPISSASAPSLYQGCAWDACSSHDSPVDAKFQRGPPGSSLKLPRGLPLASRRSTSAWRAARLWCENAPAHIRLRPIGSYVLSLAATNDARDSSLQRVSASGSSRSGRFGVRRGMEPIKHGENAVLAVRALEM